jgi:hypothetical protein
MKKLFLILSFFLFSTSILFAEYKLEPVNCTLKKKDNCGAYLYNTKTGSTYFCNSIECKEILEAIEGVSSEGASSKKSKIPKKKKSKIPKFKKKTN